jgi:hypothetical protein
MESGYNGVGSLQATETDVMSSAVDLFQPMAKEVGLRGGREVILQPTSMSSSSGPFEFLFPSHGGQYVQLSHTRLHGVCRIVKADGTNIAAAAPVSIVNMFPASLWKAIEVEVNGNVVSDLSSAHAHLKAYLETILSYGSDAQNTHLRSSLFHMDTPSQYDAAFDVPAHAPEPVDGDDDDNADDDEDAVRHVRPGAPARRVEVPRNASAALRQLLMKSSAKFDFMIPLSSDFIMSDRLLPPGVELKIRLIRNQDNLSIMSMEPNAAYTVVIDKLRLHMRLIELSPTLMHKHLSEWKTRPVVMPINRTVIRQYHISQGHASINIPSLFIGRLPKTIIVGMTTSRAYNGSYAKNPFNFQHFGCNYACLKVNGETTPSEPYTPDFANGLCMREYRAMFENTGIHHDNLGSAVSMAQFVGGTFLTVYDLSPDKCNGYHFHQPQTGNVEMTLGFTAPLAEPITCIVYASYDAQVLIHEDGQVTVAYAE